MGVKVLNKNLNELSLHLNLRNDTKYWFLKEFFAQNAEIKFIKLGHIFQIINGYSASTSDYTFDKTCFPYVRIGELSYKFDIDIDSLIYLNEDTKVTLYKKLLNNDFILASIGSTIGKINRVNNSIIGGTASNNTTILRLKDNKHFRIEFLEKLLQTYFVQKQFLGSRSQKAQPNLQPYDIKNILLPIISLKEQDKVLLKIRPILKEILAFQKTIIPTVDIINSIINSKFKLELNKLQELQKEKYNSLTLSDFANNKDMRNSCKFHCKSAQYAYLELKSRFCTKIKNFISEPIVLGASISPSDYDENGEYYYLSMATVKNWYFNSEDAQTVSEEYKNSHIAKDVKKNDIILTRSGVAIGKVAIIQDDVDAIFADFTMRIRLKNYNPLFAYYYFRSAFFQELIHTHKKGLQNKNIFPNQIQEFPIPDISSDEQQKIVDEIQIKINEQNKIKNKIDELRNSIDEIIENAIK